MSLSEQNRKKILEQFYRDADWRNPEHYPSPKTASLSRWAWEFLRRNQGFKDGMVALTTILIEHPLQGSGGDADSPGRLALKALCDKWGIDHFYPNEWLADVKSEFDSPCSFKLGGVRNVWPHRRLDCGEPHSHIIPAVDGQLVYTLNVNWPIEPQIQIIKWHANMKQKMWAEDGRQEPIKQVRLHVRKFQTYLRAFDAFQAGVTAEAIADVFSEEKLPVGGDKDYVKLAYNGDVAARRFIEDGYRLIPLCGPRKKKSSK